MLFFHMLFTVAIVFISTVANYPNAVYAAHEPLSPRKRDTHADEVDQTKTHTLSNIHICLITSRMGLRKWQMKSMGTPNV